MSESMQLRRSMLFVPGHNAAMLATAHIYKPDMIMFDLEDSVALREKDTTRLMVFHALQNPLYKDIETTVRVNPLYTPYGHKDIEAVVRAGVDVVRLPMVSTVEQVLEGDRLITEIEQSCGRAVGSTKLMAAIESAAGIANVFEIAKCCPRLMGIALAAEDYVTDLKTTRSATGEELFLARSRIVVAARAAGIACYDAVHSDVNDEEGFIAQAQLAKQMGFDGKSLVNPRQIDLLHAVYAPTEDEIDHAITIVEAATEAANRGIGVVSLNGKMVDGPIITRAERTIALARACGMKVEL